MGKQGDASYMPGYFTMNLFFIRINCLFFNGRMEFAKKKYSFSVGMNIFLMSHFMIFILCTPIFSNIVSAGNNNALLYADPIVPKICEGDEFIIQVYDIPSNSKVDSLHFIKDSDTLKFIAPAFKGTDTLILTVKSDTLGLTGNISIFNFVKLGNQPGAVTQKKILPIRIVPKIKITEHPIDRYVCQGELVTFSVKASNYDNVRWQLLTPRNIQWNYYGFAQNPDLSIPADKQNNDKFRFRAELINEGVCKAYSDPAILLIDTISPSVICPEDTVIRIDDTSCTYSFAIRPRPIKIDEFCGYNEITTHRSDNKQANEPYPLGITSVTFQVPDKSRNIGSCRYNITIQNNSTVKIPCQPNETLYLDKTCRARIKDRPLNILPPCTTSPIQVLYTGNINYTVQGSYDIEYYAQHDKVEKCITRVSVLDTFRYQLAYQPSDIFADADPGKCTKTILQDPPRIRNICTTGRETIRMITDWPENNEFLIGETIIKWGITRHNGLTDTITQKVIVNDVSQPTVICPGPVEVVLDPGECNRWVRIDHLDKGNACGKVETTNNITGTQDASAEYPAGVTNITWTVTHNNAFFRSCQQEIRVKTRPSANDDFGKTSQNESITINVLDNDIECYQTNLLTVSIAPGGNPNNGSVLVDGLKNIGYTPNSGFFGTDSFLYVIENSFGFTSEAKVFVHITEVPEIICSINSKNDASGFDANDGEATVGTSGGVPPFYYAWNNGQTSSTATNLRAGKYEVIVSDSKGQSTSCFVIIGQPEKLQCQITQKVNPSEYGLDNGAAGVTVTGGISPYFFTWNNGFTEENIFNLTAGIYSVTITDSNGYQTQCEVELTQPDPPYQPCVFLIPNGFSPNGDGIGDRFYIRCIEEYPNSSLQVFNRYGQLLFHKNNYGNSSVWGQSEAFWDGRPNKGIKAYNAILPSGTYYYIFDPGNGSKAFTGIIYLNTNKEAMN